PCRPGSPRSVRGSRSRRGWCRCLPTRGTGAPWCRHTGSRPRCRSRSRAWGWARWGKGCPQLSRCWWRRGGRPGLRLRFVGTPCRVGHVDKAAVSQTWRGDRRGNACLAE
ncbi:unnamed protein product, partial [Ectocarpus sp. 12 AP-2014]